MYCEAAAVGYSARVEKDTGLPPGKQGPADPKEQYADCNWSAARPLLFCQIPHNFEAFPQSSQTGDEKHKNDIQSDICGCMDWRQMKADRKRVDGSGN